MTSHATGSESVSWSELLPRLRSLFGADPDRLELIRLVHAVGFHDGMIAGREDATLGWIDSSRRLIDRLESGHSFDPDSGVESDLEPGIG